MANKYTDINQIPQDIIKLLKSAKSIMKNSYNRYSKYYVGAAVETFSKNIYCGTLMENASLGLTICAEPSALLEANNAGDYKIKRIAIVGGNSLHETANFITPCGRCRQIIFEASNISNYDIEIICADPSLSNIFITTINELLPYAFGPKDFNND